MSRKKAVNSFRRVCDFTSLPAGLTTAGNRVAVCSWAYSDAGSMSNPAIYILSLGTETSRRSGR